MGSSKRRKLMPTSSPSTSSPAPAPPPPPSSSFAGISALGQAFARSINFMAPPPASSQPQPLKSKGKGNEVIILDDNEEDDVMEGTEEEIEAEEEDATTEEEDALSLEEARLPPIPPPPRPLKRSSSYLEESTTDISADSLPKSPLKRDLTNESINSVPATQPRTEDKILVDPSPTLTLKPQGSNIEDDNKPTTMDAGAPPATQSVKRSAEEIAQLKEIAKAKLAIKQQETLLAKALKRDLDRKRLAEVKLAEFGFSIAPKGVSRFGSGQGGVKLEPVKGEPIAVEQEWEPNPLCSDEQRLVLEQVKKGDNVFFTGSAGVGKSFLLQEITRLLEHMKRPFQVSATTGIAALNVNGVTVHSWAGCGLGKEALLTYVDKLQAQDERDITTKKYNWKHTQTLIIDEISMMDPELFTKLSLLGKFIREDPRPFGGIQLILAGDFFQLPPVPDKNPKCIRCGQESLGVIKPEKSTLAFEPLPKGVTKPSEIRKCQDYVQQGKKFLGCGLELRLRRFCFETECWAECDFKVLELTKVFRQSDPEFIAMLEKFRRGLCDESCVELLKGCGTALGSIKIKPTNLYPHKNAVDAENTREFQKLKGQTYEFSAHDKSFGPRAPGLRRERLRDIPAAEKVLLKTGAQVLLLTNLDAKRGLVNGSRGVIVDWIHKSQTVQESDSNIAGQKQKGKRGGGFGSEEWREKAIEAFYDEQAEEKVPLVVFASGVTQAISPHTWAIDIDRENGVSRTQIPLALAWALTIHKSQGQSLDAVGVRLTSVFEKGQAYVALSRCRTPAGMKVDGFKPGHIMAHETVISFHNRLALNQSFRDTPTVAVNPLHFIPQFSPLLVRFYHKFGATPLPLPIGSAASLKPLPIPASVATTPPPFDSSQSLIPIDERVPPTGHINPYPSTSTPDAPVASTSAIPLPTPILTGHFASLPRATTTWETLLRSAAAEFATQQAGASISLFADQARQLVALAISSVPAPAADVVAEGVKAEAMSSEEDEPREETQEDSQVQTGGSLEGGTKKKKVRRAKRKKKAGK